MNRGGITTACTRRPLSRSFINYGSRARVMPGVRSLTGVLIPAATDYTTYAICGLGGWI
jgi:hypothetical protein